MTTKAVIFFLLVIVTNVLNASQFLRTQVIMGTYITISLDEKYAPEIENGFKIFKDIEASLSTFKKSSIVSKLNRNKIVELDEYTYDALIQCAIYYQKSDNYFDISIGSLTKDAYKFGSDPRVPSSLLVNSLSVGFKNIYFDDKKATLGKNVKIDFGGMGKGFAVDKVSEYFHSKGIKNGVIRASGDIRCIDTCDIEVNNPFKNKPLALFRTKNQDTGISTSGNYNRYVGSPKNNHLLNPLTKTPQTAFISITLIGSLRSADLDAYATAASVMPMKKAYSFLDSLGVAYIILQSDGRLEVSRNIKMYTQNLLINYTPKKNP